MGPSRTSSVVLVNDVFTDGSILRACTFALQSRNGELAVVAATAGQMTVRAAVTREEDLIAR
jgi:hypothetical protein